VDAAGIPRNGWLVEVDGEGEDEAFRVVVEMVRGLLEERPSRRVSLEEARSVLWWAWGHAVGGVDAAVAAAAVERGAGGEESQEGEGLAALAAILVADGNVRRSARAAEELWRRTWRTDVGAAIRCKSVSAEWVAAMEDAVHRGYETLGAAMALSNRMLA
jgi:hypothetical protein